MYGLEHALSPYPFRCRAFQYMLRCLMTHRVALHTRPHFLRPGRMISAQCVPVPTRYSQAECLQQHQGLLRVSAASHQLAQRLDRAKVPADNCRYMSLSSGPAQHPPVGGHTLSPATKITVGVVPVNLHYEPFFVPPDGLETTRALTSPVIGPSVSYLIPA